MDDDSKFAIFVVIMPFLIMAMVLAIIFSDGASVLEVVLVIVGLVFLAISVIQLSGRGAWLTAGYNTMDPEEKAQYDPVKVARGSSFIMLGLALMTFLVIPGSVTFSLIGVIVLVTFIIIGAIVMRKARY